MIIFDINQLMFDWFPILRLKAVADMSEWLAISIKCTRVGVKVKLF